MYVSLIVLLVIAELFALLVRFMPMRQPAMSQFFTVALGWVMYIAALPDALFPMML